MLELLMDLARRPALYSAHEIADRDVQRDFDQDMNVIARQGSVEDRDARVSAYLPDDFAIPQTDIAERHSGPALWLSLIHI